MNKIKYIFKNEEIYSVNPLLLPLITYLQKKETIIDEHEDSCDESSYKIAAMLLLSYAQLWYEEKGEVIKTPIICNAPDNGIDIEWDFGTWGFVIEYSESDKYCGFYYYDKTQGFEKSGHFNPNKPITNLKFWENVEYNFKGEFVYSVSPDLAYLVEYLHKKEFIADLQDDWDEEGSKGYNHLTWKTTAYFLLSYAQQVYEIHNVLIDKPRIMEGPNGSIDIYWETPEYGLIVNIKENGKDAFYFGDVKQKDKIRGNFNPYEIENNIVNFLVKQQSNE